MLRETVEDLQLDSSDETERTLALVRLLFWTALDEDDHGHAIAFAALRHLHRVYQWTRTFDRVVDKGARFIHRRRVQLTPQMMPAYTMMTFQEVEALCTRTAMDRHARSAPPCGRSALLDVEIGRRGRHHRRLPPIG